MRVVIAEDEALLRAALTSILEEKGFTVVAAVGSLDTLERAVSAYEPDLVVTDVRMPPTRTDEGLVAALRIRERFPNIAVVILSQFAQYKYAHDLIQSDAKGIGYLLKYRVVDADSFVSDVVRVANGGTVFDPEIISVLMTKASHSSSEVSKLTNRQREVLELMAQGLSNQAIAEQLTLTEKAIAQHTSNIYEALGLAVDQDAHRRVLAVLRYLDDDQASQ